MNVIIRFIANVINCGVKPTGLPMGAVRHSACSFRCSFFKTIDISRIIDIISAWIRLKYLKHYQMKHGSALLSG